METINLRMTMRLVSCVSDNLRLGRREKIISPDSLDPRDFHEARRLSDQEYRDIAEHATEMLSMFGDDVTITYDDRIDVAAFIQTCD